MTQPLTIDVFLVLRHVICCGPALATPCRNLSLPRQGCGGEGRHADRGARLQLWTSRNNVGSWHEADMLNALTNVRFWGDTVAKRFCAPKSATLILRSGGNAQY